MMQQEIIANIILNSGINVTNIYSTPLINPGSYPIKTSEIGSGTFVIIGGQSGILTNYHVAEMFYHSSNINVLSTNSSLLSLTYSLAIHLPPLGHSGMDMAFFVLTDSMHNIVIEKLNKQFFDLDKSNQELEENYRKNIKNSLWIIYGNVTEGKKNINNKKLWYKNAGPHIVVPDLDNIKYEYCDYGTFKIVADNVICPIKTDYHVPSSFEGMSGAALWRINLDTKCKIQKIVLFGIATSYGPAKKAEYLLCQGPIALYNGFYPFVLGVLEQKRRSNMA